MNIIQATKKNNLELVKKLIKANGANIGLNLQNKYKSTALILASDNGYIKIVKELIEAGANINLQDKYGYSALLIASKSGYKNGYLDIIKELIKFGAYIDQKFIKVINKYSIDILKLLINKDFDIALKYVKKFNKQKDILYYIKLIIHNGLNEFVYEKGLINIILNYYILI
jgi:ankyrin repeat protein